MKINININLPRKTITVSITEITSIPQLWNLIFLTEQAGLTFAATLGDQLPIHDSLFSEEFCGTVNLPINFNFLPSVGFGEQYDQWKNKITSKLSEFYSENDFYMAERKAITELKRQQEALKQCNFNRGISFYQMNVSNYNEMCPNEASTHFYGM